MRVHSRVVVLVIAALIAASTAVLVRKKMMGPAGTHQVQSLHSKRVLVARRDLPAGKFIEPGGDLEWSELAAADVASGAVIREGQVKKSDFSGAVLRKPLKAGMPVAPDEITKAGEGGFLSAVLEPGMRAVSIAVTATTGAAGFIAPGDRVDLIVTHRVKPARSGQAANDTVMSDTFVRDVRVVAVDQSLNTPENKAQLAKNVTVEVNESQAEQIAVATEMGKISLALRSAVQGEAASVTTPERASTRTGDVIPGLLQSAKGAPHVQVIRGDQKEELQFNDQGAP